MAKRVVPEELRRRRRPTRSGVVLSERLIVDAALRLLGSTAARGSPPAASASPSTATRARSTATSAAWTT